MTGKKEGKTVLNENNNTIGKLNHHIANLKNAISEKDRVIFQLKETIPSLQEALYNVKDDNAVLKNTLKESDVSIRKLYLKLKKTEKELNQKSIDFVNDVRKLKKSHNAKIKNILDQYAKEKLNIITDKKPREVSIAEQEVLTNKSQPFSDEIRSSIEIALQHNHPLENITQSLVASGYSQSDVEREIRTLKIKIIKK